MKEGVEEVKAQCSTLPVSVNVLEGAYHTQEKADFIARLGQDRVAAVGNGANDRLMLEQAALGIAVIGLEGAAVPALMSADIVVKDILDALGLLLNSRRLVATLRQ